MTFCGCKDLIRLQGLQAARFLGLIDVILQV